MRVQRCLPLNTSLVEEPGENLPTLTFDPHDRPGISASEGETSSGRDYLLPPILLNYWRGRP